MHVITTVIVVLIAVAGFADFLMNDGDKKRLNARLTEWWYEIEAGDWRGLTVWSVRTVNRFLDATFGARLFSLRAVFVCLALAMVYTVVAFYGRLDVNVRSVLDPMLWVSFVKDGQLPGNWAGEFVEVTSLRAILRWLENKPYATWPALLLSCILVAHIGSATSSTIVLSMVHADIDPIPWLPAAVKWLSFPVFGFASIEFWLTDRSGFDIERYWVLPPIITSSSLLVIFLLLWIVRIARPVTQPLLARIVEQLASAPKGAIAAAAGLLAICSSLVDKLFK